MGMAWYSFGTRHAVPTRSAYRVTHPESMQDVGRPAAHPHEIRREIYDFLKMVVYFLLLFVCLRFFVVEGYEVQGPSMEPTLQNGDRILVFKLPHKLAQAGFLDFLTPIHENDIVVFESLEDASKRYVKRVIAMGPRGSRAVRAAHTDEGISENAVSVRIERGTVYVNNQRIDELYLPDDLRFRSSARTTYLQENEFYVMGDNRDVSKDSRSFGPIGDKDIIGKAVFRFWPLSRLSWIE
jgi:signal peptidase I